MNPSTSKAINAASISDGSSWKNSAKRGAVAGPMTSMRPRTNSRSASARSQVRFASDGGGLSDDPNRFIAIHGANHFDSLGRQPERAPIRHAPDALPGGKRRQKRGRFASTARGFLIGHDAEQQQRFVQFIGVGCRGQASLQTRSIAAASRIPKPSALAAESPARRV